MSKPMSFGDIIKANTGEKLDLAVGAASWYGWFLTFRGLKKIWLSHKYNKLAKKLEKERPIDCSADIEAEWLHLHV